MCGCVVREVTVRGEGLEGESRSGRSHHVELLPPVVKKEGKNENESCRGDAVLLSCCRKKKNEGFVVATENERRKQTSTKCEEGTGR